ncbi:MAG: VOC family protein [Gammaproteobacteria bacterium]|nr:VOC family protein [Gammaproteobacteria bacterium]
MALQWLDHVNIRTARLGAMTRFYEEVVGLPAGPRPPFGFGGTWLYLDDKAVVHLVETDEPPAGEDPRIEHFAFRATDHADFIERLKAYGVDYRLATVPESGLRQIHFTDPDGNHIEVGFPPD